MVRTKVFVGNLSFATKENELAKEFEVAGKVISANIITRGPRSLGYGFVEMDSESDAENAVKLLNKKEIDGRPINVEVAKPREEGADDKGGNNNNGGANGGRGGRGTRGGSRGASRGGSFGGGFRRRFRRRDGSDDEGEGGSDEQQQRGGEGSRGGPRGGSRGGPRGGPREGSRGGPRRGGRGGSSGPRVPRDDQKKEDQRAPSKTLLFVANLPFSLDNDTFAKLFKDATLPFKTCHVVKKRSGRSKGFGFVEFENEVDQQKALTAMNNKNVEGRDLVVKVALTDNKTEESSNNNNTSTTSNTTTSTTTSNNNAAPSTPKTTATSTTPSTEKKETATEEKKTEAKPSTPKTEQKK